MSVCAKFGVDRVNGHGDIRGGKLSKNVCEKGGAVGGAREGRCGKSRLDVVI